MDGASVSFEQGLAVEFDTWSSDVAAGLGHVGRRLGTAGN